MAGAIYQGNFDVMASKSVGASGELRSFEIELITSRKAIKGNSEIERATEGGEIMIYGLGGKRGVLPSEVKRRFEISLTRDEIEDSILGDNLSGIATQELIASAKSDIMLAINEIAKTTNIQLSQEEKEKLANFSIYLLNRLGSVV